jgi:molybdopterin converting factor small subunit
LAIVWIPAQLRVLTNDRETVDVPGASNVAEVIEQLDKLYPGMHERLCTANSLRPGISVAVDSHVATLGMRQPVHETSEVHFVPAISGG